MRARVLLAVLAFLSLPSAAAAHARVSSVSPGAERLALVMSAPVERDLLRVDGDDSDGVTVEVDQRDDRIVQVLRGRSGARDVTVVVLSGDGHVSRIRVDLEMGRVVDETSSRGRLLAIVGRVLLFVGLLGGIGLIAVRRAVLARALDDPGVIRSPGGLAKASVVIGRATRGWWSAWWVSVGLACLGLLLGLQSQVSALDSGWGDLSSLVGGTRWGIAWTAEIVLIGLAGVLAASTIDGVPRSVRQREWSPLAPLVAVAGVLAWSGHAAGGTDAALDVGFDTLHTVAAGAWLGGLAGLLIAIRNVGRGEGDSTPLAAAIVIRFSAVAIACVGAIVVTGVYRSLSELRGFGDLVDTAYGRVLLVKLVIFGALLGSGVYNRAVLHRRLERAALGLADDDRGAARALRRSVSVEIAIAMALLVSVGVLVNLPPP